MGLGIRGWRRVDLGICKVGGVGYGSHLALWILCSAVRTISFSRETANSDYLPAKSVTVWVLLKICLSTNQCLSKHQDLK